MLCLTHCSAFGLLNLLSVLTSPAKFLSGHVYSESEILGNQPEQWKGRDSERKEVSAVQRNVLDQGNIWKMEVAVWAEWWRVSLVQRLSPAPHSDFDVSMEEISARRTFERIIAYFVCCGRKAAVTSSETEASKSARDRNGSATDESIQS